MMINAPTVVDFLEDINRTNSLFSLSVIKANLLQLLERLADNLSFSQESENKR